MCIIRILINIYAHLFVCINIYTNISTYLFCRCRMDEEHTLVVQATHTDSPLNEGSLLFFSDGSVIGKISEIFGPITTPFYIVRWAVSVQPGGGGMGSVVVVIFFGVRDIVVVVI